MKVPRVTLSMALGIVLCAEVTNGARLQIPYWCLSATSAVYSISLLLISGVSVHANEFITDVSSGLVSIPSSTLPSPASGSLLYSNIATPTSPIGIVTTPPTSSSPELDSPPPSSESSNVATSSSISMTSNATSNATLTSAQATPTTDPTTLVDIEVMTQRRLSFIVAGVSGASDIPQWLSTLGSDGKWPDSEIDYTTGCDARRANWPAQDHWIRTLTMSAAWNGGLQGAEQYVKSPVLLDAISRAMDFWFENDFTDPSCLDSGGTASCPCGTPGLWNTNWFSNIILIPNLVSQSCLLLNDNLTTTQHSNCTHITGRTYGTFGHSVNGLGIATGANLLDIAKIGIDQGLLNQNASILIDAYGRIHNEVIIENTIMADGIRADGSFGQHGGVIYNGNYGKDFANDVLFLEIVAGGTQFAAGDITKDAFAALIDGDQWMIYRNILTGVLHWDFSVLGRFISFPVVDDQATGSIKINVTEIEELGEEWNSTVLTSAFASLSGNTTDANVGSINGNRMFFANDYMVQRGDGYVTTLKMYSSRTKNTECLNAQNLLGIHLSDGTVYTYLQGSEYEDISVAWDWNLIPGITVDYGVTPLSCDHASFTGLNSFVGGASDGKIGAAAMRFTNPSTKSLSWQKAWFFLDDDVQHVMIPVINSSTDSPVFSVLDQKRHKQPVLVDGLSIGDQTNFTRPFTLWHDNVGYLFDHSSCAVNISVEVGPKTGNWSDIGISTQGVATVDLFAAWIDHGSGTPIAPVSYTVFPAVDPSSFLKKTFATRLRQIQNDQDVSAVFDDTYRTAMIVFWNSAGGSTQLSPSQHDAPITISADGNAVVLYRLDTGAVTVSDPSQTLLSLHLNFTIGVSGAVPQGFSPGLSRQLTFPLPSGGLAGSSVTQKL